MSNSKNTATDILNNAALVERGEGSVYVCAVRGMLFSIGLCPTGAGWYASAWDGTTFTDVRGETSAKRVVELLLEQGPTGRACIAFDLGGR